MRSMRSFAYEKDSSCKAVKVDIVMSSGWVEMETSFSFAEMVTYWLSEKSISLILSGVMAWGNSFFCMLSSW